MKFLISIFTIALSSCAFVSEPGFCHSHSTWRFYIRDSAYHEVYVEKSFGMVIFSNETGDVGVFRLVDDSDFTSFIENCNSDLNSGCEACLQDYLELFGQMEITGLTLIDTTKLDWESKSELKLHVYQRAVKHVNSNR